MTMYETCKCTAVIADATTCLKSNMAAKKPEVLISHKLWHYVVKIPTANLPHSTMANSQEVYLGDSNNQRQSEMAAEAGSTYIS